MSNVIILAAQAAGYYCTQGDIKKGAGNTISIPEGMINIGGNGHGYILEAQQDISPVAVENRDDSFTSLTIGDDVYIYATQHESGTAKIVFSKNSTFPNGFDAINSRKIGGFHYAKVRPMAQKFNKSYNCLTEIVPNSVWCESHRPTCEPTGMAEFMPGTWVDIYPASIKAGTGMSAILQSKYNAVPVTGTEGYCYADFAILLRSNGKRQPNYWEFRSLAYGMPQGATGQSGRINTGLETGYGFNPVSCQNINQVSGNVYMVGAELFDRGVPTDRELIPAAWQEVGEVEDESTGIDAGQNIGKWHGMVIRQSLYGAAWNRVTQAGSGAVNLNNAPWIVHSHVGPRGVCDSRNR